PYHIIDTVADLRSLVAATTNGGPRSGPTRRATRTHGATSESDRRRTRRLPETACTARSLREPSQVLSAGSTARPLPDHPARGHRRRPWARGIGGGGAARARHDPEPAVGRPGPPHLRARNDLPA